MSNFTKLKENLEKKGYAVSVFECKNCATEYLKKEISGKTVGFGGSVTLDKMNLFEALSENNTVYWHDKKPEDVTVMEARRLSSGAQVYISSVNGISENGEIVNIDNTGNRVAAISFGPQKVYLVVGANKVAETLEDAICRARNVASPLNAKRLNRNTPCACNADKCYDCKSNERICRILSILMEKPTGAEYEVVLINEELGY